MKKIMHSICWKVLSCFCFAITNIIVRYLTGGSKLDIEHSLSIHVIIMFQYLFGLIFFLPWLFRSNILSEKFNFKITIFHIARTISAISGVSLWYISLKHLPITQVTALGFLSPIITIIAAVIILKEHINHNRAIAIIISIIGSYLILQPYKDFGELNKYGIYCIFPISAAAMFALDKIAVKKLLNMGASAESLTTILMISLGLTSAIISGMSGSIHNILSNIKTLLLLGAVTTLATYSFNKAYKSADVTFLMPIGMIKIIFSIILSYTIFREIPENIEIWIGIIMIFCSTIILSIKKNKA